MNYMKEVAQLLGVEFGEEFEIEGNLDYKYRLTEKHLEYFSNDQWHTMPNTITCLLNGKCKVVKILKPILDDVEREYLSAVIKPFRDRVRIIYKFRYTYSSSESIVISIKDDNNVYLPSFERGTMYKGMELEKAYSLEELGL